MQKRHHTVPRSYLEQFTDANGDVWVLDTSNKIFNTRPHNILVESHFYRITLKDGSKRVVVENTLADIEGKYATIFRDKLSQDKFLTTEERAHVSVFLAALLHRTRANRDGLRGMLTSLKKVAEEWGEQFKVLSSERKRALRAIPSTGHPISIEEIAEGLENWDEHHSASLIDHIAHTAQIIFQMKWSVWKYPTNQGNFLTSDDPFVMRRPAAELKYGKAAIGARPGLAFRDVEVTVPLSKEHLLLAGWILEHDSYMEVPVDRAEAMNQRVILGSSKQVIACSKAQLEEVMAKYPPLPKQAK